MIHKVCSYVCVCSHAYACKCTKKLFIPHLPELGSESRALRRHRRCARERPPPEQLPWPASDCNVEAKSRGVKLGRKFGRHDAMFSHHLLMLEREEDTVSNTVSNISRRESYCTISFLHTQIQGRLFVSVDFCGASSCSRTGCRQVARYMHDPNGIIDARSASPLAPDLAAAISDEGLWNLASWLSPCNQKYTMRSDISILDRNVSQFGI